MQCRLWWAPFHTPPSTLLSNASPSPPHSEWKCSRNVSICELDQPTPLQIIGYFSYLRWCFKIFVIYMFIFIVLIFSHAASDAANNLKRNVSTVPVKMRSFAKKIDNDGQPFSQPKPCPKNSLSVFQTFECYHDYHSYSNLL